MVFIRLKVRLNAKGYVTVLVLFFMFSVNMVLIPIAEQKRYYLNVMHKTDGNKRVALPGAWWVGRRTRTASAIVRLCYCSALAMIPQTRLNTSPKIHKGIFQNYPK